MSKIEVQFPVIENKMISGWTTKKVSKRIAEHQLGLPADKRSTPWKYAKIKPTKEEELTEIKKQQEALKKRMEELKSSDQKTEVEPKIDQ